MRIAWFTDGSTTSAHPLDDTRSLLAELASRHVVELYDEARAHDFVWHSWKAPFDVCVYELSDTLASAFIWPYLLHYPGIVRLRSSRLRRSRRQWLHLNRRTSDDTAEAAFAGSDALRIPFTMARLIVVGDAFAADALQERYPAARLRHAPIAVTSPPARVAPEGVPVFGVAATPSTELVLRAVHRARDAGSALDVQLDIAAPSAYDAIIALEWPPRPEPPAGALFAIAAGCPAIVYEVPVTAGWPALDPQTWTARGGGHHEPIVISLDPRDEEHSLMLALRRLADDAPFRARMGEAARAWSAPNGTVAQSAEAWERLLVEAATLKPPPRPADWPAHLTPDGTARARELMSELGVGVDFLAD